MPKKKVQYKEKLKHASEENEEFDFKKHLNENAEEEYTNVVEFEINRKYNKRLIESNWSKYEASLSDYDTEDEENIPAKTGDFTDLVKTSSSDCSYFEFNSEKLWKSEHHSVPASKIFNLNLNILSKGLACVPFYKRLGLDERELSVEDKENFDREANNNWKDYNAIKEKIPKKVEDDSRNLEKSFTVKLDLEGNNKEDQKKGEVTELVRTDKTVEKEELYPNSHNSDTDVKENKQGVFFSKNDENLEDWLDSVLGD